MFIKNKSAEATAGASQAYTRNVGSTPICTYVFRFLHVEPFQAWPNSEPSKNEKKKKEKKNTHKTDAIQALTMKAQEALISA